MFTRLSLIHSLCIDICLGTMAESLACRWMQICAIGINTSAINASIPTKEVPMRKKIIREQFKAIIYRSMLNSQRWRQTNLHPFGTSGMW